METGNETKNNKATKESSTKKKPATKRSSTRKKSKEEELDFFQALDNLGTEHSVEREVIIEKVKIALQKAAQRIYPECKECIRVDIDPDKRVLDVILLQEIVEAYPIYDYEVALDEARTIDPNAMVGGILERKLDISKFGRTSAQSAKQSIRGDLRDINRDRILEKFSDKENDIITATITQIDPIKGSATLEYDKTELYLLRQEQSPNDKLEEGMVLKVYVSGIVNKNKKPIIKLSRVHKDLVKRLFELEVPEIYDGTVEVRSIAREAGFRSKIAVSSRDPHVDALGACIGPKRSRINAIVKELRGEKIDIIPYKEDPGEFISAALLPAKVQRVIVTDYETRMCTVVVPNDQLSLAIGNRGQNAKLAAKLTGFKIDIKSDQDPTPLPEEGVRPTPVEEIPVEDDEFLLEEGVETTTPEEELVAEALSVDTLAEEDTVERTENSEEATR